MLLRLLSDTKVSPSSITKRTILEFNKTNHKALVKWEIRVSWKRIDRNFQMLSDTSCFWAAHEITGARFSFIVPRALRNRSKPDTHKDRSYVSVYLGFEFFLSFHQEKSYCEMFLEASVHSRKNRVEHICNKRWLQRYLLQKGQEWAAKLVCCLRDLKSNRVTASHAGAQDKVIQRGTPVTLPASNSSAKPIKTAGKLSGLGVYAYFWFRPAWKGQFEGLGGMRSWKA